MGTLLTSARSGSSRKLYVSLRNAIAAKLDDCESGRDYAALAKTLVSVQEKIETIDATAARAARESDNTSKLNEARNKRMKLVANG